MMISRHAITVVTNAPTATNLEKTVKCFRIHNINGIYQKSLGLPSQVRGVITAETISIHKHKFKSSPMAKTRDLVSWAIKTMKTQPAP